MSLLPKLESLIGSRIEVHTTHGAPFNLLLDDVNSESVYGHDDDGVAWAIRRAAIIMYREIAKKASVKKSKKGDE